MIYGRVTESDGEIVAVSLSQEYAHKLLLDDLVPALARELYKSGDAYAIVGSMAADVLAPDVANLQPATETVNANSAHVCGLVRALHLQGLDQWFGGTEVERAIAGARAIFRALQHANTPDYKAEHLLFETGVAALKDLVNMEAMTA